PQMGERVEPAGDLHDLLVAERPRGVDPELERLARPDVVAAHLGAAEAGQLAVVGVDDAPPVHAQLALVLGHRSSSGASPRPGAGGQMLSVNRVALIPSCGDLLLSTASIAADFVPT